jgi:hypothetical protein
MMKFLIDNAPSLTRQRNRWRPGPRTMVAVALIVAVAGMAGIALFLRVHLFWRYTEHRLGWRGIQAIPNSPMPESPIPSTWVPCRVGCVEFKLPPELAGNRTLTDYGTPIVTFQHGMRGVIVFCPTDGSEFSEFLQMASDQCPGSQRFTLPKLRLACYQASSDDFRWSMTVGEVRWHAYRITTRKLIDTSTRSTETLFQEGLDEILEFGLANRGVLEWWSSDPACVGSMHIVDRSETLDPTWIRAVCRSLRVLSQAETK